MNDELISVIDIAKIHGKHKAYVFKILKRLGIDAVKQKNSGSKGQRISYITQEDYDLLKEHLETRDRGSQSPDIDSNLGGVFYLIQLEPEHDPGRFKLGFATNLEERLRSHKTAAPFSKILKYWPCKLLWEKTAIDCVVQGCERLHTEVFRTESISQVLERCEQFFAQMPEVNQK